MIQHFTKKTRPIYICVAGLISPSGASCEPLEGLDPTCGTTGLKNLLHLEQLQQ